MHAAFSITFTRSYYYSNRPRSDELYGHCLLCIISAIGPSFFSLLSSLGSLVASGPTLENFELSLPYSKI